MAYQRRSTAPSRWALGAAGGWQVLKALHASAVVQQFPGGLGSRARCRQVPSLFNIIV